jgi:2-polyprenyl-3-methyl-5-hydroxy-6-metoxy-1,4-benzoquinol methylase
VSHSPLDPSEAARAEGSADWLVRLPPVKLVDRRAFILEEIEGRRVAHLGFADVGCEITRASAGSWLHAAMAQKAKELVGLDISEEAVELARVRGYAAACVDLTDRASLEALNLQPFELVVAGEIIEHVDDVGLFLDSLDALIAPSGRLLLTTPNAHRLVDLVIAATGRELVHPDHVHLYSAATLSRALSRRGWVVERSAMYLNPLTPFRRQAKVSDSLRTGAVRCSYLLQRRLSRRISPYLADGLIVVAKRVAA